MSDASNDQRGPTVSRPAMDLCGMTRHANQATATMVCTILERQAELAKLEVEIARLLFSPLLPGTRPLPLGEYYAQMQASSDRLIGYVRYMSDLARQSGWQLLGVSSNSESRP
jgi:hypothetical protein